MKISFTVCWHSVWHAFVELLLDFYTNFSQCLLSFRANIEQLGWSREVQISCRDGVYPSRLIWYQLIPASLHCVEYGVQEGCMHVA